MEELPSRPNLIPEFSSTEEMLEFAKKLKSNAYHKDWRDKNKEKVRKYGREYQQRTRTPESNRKYNIECVYGITIEQWEDMLIAQGGTCANPYCDRTDSGVQGKPLFTDHDKNTEIVRGLLCNQCNLFMGRVDDNLGILDWAREYIKRGNPDEV